MSYPHAPEWPVPRTHTGCLWRSWACCPVRRPEVMIGWRFGAIHHGNMREGCIIFCIDISNYIYILVHILDILITRYIIILDIYIYVYMYLVYTHITDPIIYPILIFFEVTRYITAPESSVVLVKGVVLPGILGISLSSMSWESSPDLSAVSLEEPSPFWVCAVGRFFVDCGTVVEHLPAKCFCWIYRLFSSIFRVSGEAPRWF